MRRWLYVFVLILALIPMLAAAQDTPSPVQKALDDLNARTGLSLKPEDITWRFGQKTFDDASLGCPQPGKTYYHGKTLGYTVQFDVQNVTWDYRVSSDLQVTLCNQAAIMPIATASGTAPASQTTSTGIAPTPPVICQGAPPSRLHIDGMAQLVPKPTVTVRIYRTTNLVDAVNEVHAGDTLKVLDGPLCTGGKAWWEIADMQNYSRGWVAENERSAYVLEPLYELTVTRTNSTGTQAYPTPSVNQSCPGALPSRLVPHDRARVRTAVETHIYAVFNQLSSAQFDITAGRTVQIINGPYCAPDAAWWGILDYETGFQGWIIEGKDTYFFDPLAGSATDSADCTPRLRSRLFAGYTVRTLVPIALLATPESDAHQSPLIPVGTTFTLVNGPRCVDDTTYWATIYNGLWGWIQEANDTDYLVEPVA